MHQLDNLARLGQLDRKNMLDSIALLPRQIEQAWAETQKLKIAASYKKINKVVVNGMGGSGLGTHLIRSVYFKKLKLPLGNIHSYDLPGLIDKNTLYIISSYSGSTEEPISTFKEAKRRGAQVLGITAGGDLAELIQSGQIPGYIFEPRHNPCGQPRIGLGYSIIGLLGLLNKCGVVSTTEKEINSILGLLSQMNEEFTVRQSFTRNSAKKMAVELQGKIPIIVASEFLSGNAHILANQVNENAKNFSTYFLISELNHHLLEGLAHPALNRKNLHFLFLESNLYHTRNRQRYQITEDIIKQNKVGYTRWLVPGGSELEQSFGALLFGSYLSFYLAMLNGVDPAGVPFVDYFKKQLAN